MNFCDESYTLLEPITTGNDLKFKSNKTGKTYASKPEDTLLASEDSSNILTVSKYYNTIKVSAYDPVNTKIKLENGCEKCHRQIVTMLRVGVEKKVIYSCICGYQFSI